MPQQRKKCRQCNNKKPASSTFFGLNPDRKTLRDTCKSCEHQNFLGEKEYGRGKPKRPMQLNQLGF